MFHTYVASILTGCCICFTMIFKYFCKYFKCIFQVFHLSSAACCKCSSGCFKSRWGVASSSSLSAARLGVSTPPGAGWALAPFSSFSMLVIFGTARTSYGLQAQASGRLSARSPNYQSTCIYAISSWRPSEGCLLASGLDKATARSSMVGTYDACMWCAKVSVFGQDSAD
jgi:hypothetical protein